MNYKVLIPDRISDNPGIERDVFGNDAEIILANAKNASEISDDIWGNCDAVLAWHELTYSKDILKKLRKCKVIVRVGVGYDNIDLKSAKELGITICNVPDYGTDDVADHTLALMTSLCRGIIDYNKAAKEGNWKWEVGSNLRRIKGSTLGIIGLGRIGTAVAIRAKSFGLNVLFYDPYKPYGYEKTLSIERAESLSELASKSDIITVHAPLTEETNKMLDGVFFNSCKQNTIFINTARGAIVDLDALYAAMKNGNILFSGLDVLPVEPPDFAHPLLKAWKNNENGFEGRVIITPHSAFYNQDSFIEMRRKAAEEALRVLQSKKPFYQITEDSGAGKTMLVTNELLDNIDKLIEKKLYDIAENLISFLSDKDTNAEIIIRDIKINILKENLFFAEQKLNKLVKTGFNSSDIEKNRNVILSKRDQLKTHKKWSDESRGQNLLKAEMYYDKNEYDKAEFMLMENLNVLPGDIESLNDLAVVYVSMDKYERAKYIYDIIFEYDPANEVAKENILLMNERIENTRLSMQNEPVSQQVISSARNVKKQNNKLVMTFLVRDEVKMIKENIEYHFNHGVDFVVAMDNGSINGTRDLLESYSKEGIMYLINEPEQNYDQTKWLTRMGHIARDKFNAGWIMSNDADEFWVPKSGNYKTELTDADYNVLECGRYNMLPSEDIINDKDYKYYNNIYKVVNPFARTEEKDNPEKLLSMFKLNPKVITSSAGLEVIYGGNHTVKIADMKKHESEDIEIYHYPYQDYGSFLKKVINGGSSLKKNTSEGDTFWSYMRRWYEIYLNGQLPEEYKRLILNERLISKYMSEKRIVIDDTLKRELTEKSNIDADEQIAKLYDNQFYNEWAEWKEDYDLVAGDILSQFDFNSVIDLGCGNGYIIENFNSKSKIIAGVEGSSTSLAFISDTIKDKIKIKDLRFPLYVGRYDLVICMEVAEHMEEEYADTLVDNVCRHAKKYIYFTGATPEQTGGTGHVNLQLHSYWIKKFNERGFEYNQSKSDQIRASLYGKVNRIKWIPKNTMIFEKKPHNNFDI